MNRFFEKVTVEEAEEGFMVLLDGRQVKTPAKASLLLPTKAAAEGVAGEWNSQNEKIEPATMPLMQAAATAIDRISTQREKVIEDIVAYGGTDLVCYRASYPESLVIRQSATWDPMLDWISKRYDVKLKIGEGIAHIPQSPEALANMRAVVNAQKDMTLAPLYNITSLSGSLVIALAVLDGHLSADEAFEASELEETHTIEMWGEDAEATKRRKNNKESLIASIRFLRLCGIIA